MVGISNCNTFAKQNRNIMKHTLIIISIIYLLFSCEKTKEQEDKNVVIDKRGFTPDYTISVEVVDSCEYIVLDGSYGRSIVHKQNCKNHK